MRIALSDGDTVNERGVLCYASSEHRQMDVCVCAMLKHVSCSNFGEEHEYINLNDGRM
jgi:hypothetical protein